ncbi:hypothetical protein DPMN_133217 [Dreissena polymorpha]|uniref:Uncharacterized protein n=1 Tax=Dreissena polymorpha TaxID=45954 RepID=A0A9D4FT46_DREPO|nr:hypothetical protein DPMN_133217 [Dreissena polymorpha]
MAKMIQTKQSNSTDVIQSSEVFPPHYKAYRNERGALGGGVFVPVLVTEERAE